MRNSFIVLSDCILLFVPFKGGGGGGRGSIRIEPWRQLLDDCTFKRNSTTRKHSKVEPSDGHISTTKKDNKILRRNSLPLLSYINITKPIHYPLANVGGDTFWPTLDAKSKCCLLVDKFFQLHSMSLKSCLFGKLMKNDFSDIQVCLLSFCCFF